MEAKVSLWLVCQKQIADCQKLTLSSHLASLNLLGFRCCKIELRSQISIQLPAPRTESQMAWLSSARLSAPYTRLLAICISSR